MKKLLKFTCLFLCLLIIGTFTVACGGGGGGSSSGGGYGYIPAITPNNPNNPNDPINPVNPAYQSVTLNDEVLQQLYELGIIETTDKAEFDKNKLTSIDIPATYTYNGTKYQITAIADRLFYNCVNLKTVYIPDTVSSIGDFAFWNVDHIYYNKAIPYNRYGWGALNVNDDEYKEVDLLYCDRNTNQSTFDHLVDLGYVERDKLISVHIPPLYIYNNTKYKIISISEFNNGSGNYNFLNTEHITPQNLVLPASFNCIDECAFNGCESLETIEIPNSVIDIGKKAFGSCSSLKSIKIPNKLKTIKEDTFYGCYSLKEVVIPNSITSIEDYAFWGCNSLKNLEIPDSVTTLGDRCFNSCKQLETVKLSKNIQNISDHTFWEDTALKSIEIPKSVITIGIGAFDECTALTNVKIEEGSNLTTIKNSAFCNCTSLESINIPDGVTVIEGYAFFNCTSLVVTIPDSVIEIQGINSYQTGTFANVPHIYYNVIYTDGMPWGALAIN